jgi:hypothetical protein
MLIRLERPYTGKQIFEAWETFCKSDTHEGNVWFPMIATEGFQLRMHGSEARRYFYRTFMATIKSDSAAIKSMWGNIGQLKLERYFYEDQYEWIDLKLELRRPYVGTKDTQSLTNLELHDELKRIVEGFYKTLLDSNPITPLQNPA